MTFASENSSIKLEAVLYPKEPIRPKQFYTYIFRITNTGSILDTFSITPAIPETWQQISTLADITLAPSQSKTIFLTCAIPPDVSSDKDFYVNIKAASTTDPAISKTIKTTTRFMPYARPIVIPPSKIKKIVGGKKIQYKIKVINGGTGKDSFFIKVHSINLKKIRLSKSKVTLAPGQKEEIIISATAPKKISSGIRDIMFLTVSSNLLDKSIEVKKELITFTIARKIKDQTLYKTLPAELTTYVSGITTTEEREMGPQIKFTTGGALDKGYKMDFLYEGPDWKDKRENHLRVSDEEVLFEIGKQDWTLSTGDVSHTISYLLGNQAAKGYKFEIHKDNFGATAFSAKERLTDHDKYGGKIRKMIGENTEVAYNFLRELRTNESDSNNIFKETEVIHSISFKNRLKNFFTQGEIAESTFDSKTNTFYEKERAKAGWIKTIYEVKKMKLELEYVHAGTNFKGQRTDTKGYRSYLTYRINRKLYMWASHDKSHNNLDDLAGKSTSFRNDHEVGFSFTNKILSQLTGSYKRNTTRTYDDLLTTDLKEDIYKLTASKKIGNTKIYFEKEFKRRSDPLNTIKNKIWTYTTSIYRYWKTLTFWIRYQSTKDLNLPTAEKSYTTTQEIGMNWRISRYMHLDGRYTNNKSNDGDKDDLIQLKLKYRLDSDSEFVLEAKMDENYEKDGDKWKLWLAYKRKFDVLIPFVKVKAILSGMVFLDKNNNGIRDNGEKGIPNIPLFMDFEDYETTTKKNGKYKFGACPAGDYHLDIDIQAIPLDISPSVDFPIPFTLTKGLVKRIDIPVVNVYTITGHVFFDKNKNKKQEENELGVNLVKISLYKNGTMIFETLTDQEGYYIFKNVPPGNYKVIANKDWLPERHIFTTTFENSVNITGENRTFEFDFGTVEKKRQILVTRF